MKKLVFTAVAAASVLTAVAQVSPMENLDRGLVVAKGQEPGTYFASWRLLPTDAPSTAFTILRDGKPYINNVTGATSAVVKGAADSRWQVAALVDGKVLSTSKAVLPWAMPYLKYHLMKPTAGPDYDYTINDCSVGDVDGDGQYELIVKWEPTNARDNSQGGMTGAVVLDCYKFDMEAPAREPRRLWSINLGPNIRAGAHYTQFLVYDFDGDGRAELMCKTAPGSRDGRGRYVNEASDDPVIRAADNHRDWRNSQGRVNGGQEYLTVFSGTDGRAVSTIFYNPNRNTGLGGDAEGTFVWGDAGHGLEDNGSYGNRGERYLAAVAYLGGRDARPSAVFTRGYYSYAFAWAVDYDGRRLKTRWLNESRDGQQYAVTDSLGHRSVYTAAAPTSGEGSGTLFANGNHNLSVADVDGDGRDEVLWGSAALDDDGRMLYATGFGHGDAIHLAKLNPQRSGLEVFDVHEERGTYAWDVHDAATGEILLKGGPAGIDNGRGLAAQIDSRQHAYSFWSAGDPTVRSAADGSEQDDARLPVNFRIYWDGDAQDELLDGVNIRKWEKGHTSMLGIFGTVNKPDPETAGWGDRPWRRKPMHRGSEADNRSKPTAQTNDRRKAVKHEPGFFGERSFQRPTVSFAGYGTPASNNWTKNNPCLQADLFGDWREEVIYRDATDPTAIYIYTSQIPTPLRYPTLMSDHTYRMGIAWQNVGYNQPPHVGVFLPDEMRKYNK